MASYEINLLVFGFVSATLLLFSLATARELAETTEQKNVNEAGVKDQKYPGEYGYGGYPGHGGNYGGGYPGRGGGYPGRGGGGGYNGGYPGHGHGGGYGYCRWGCCRRGYYGGCRCCSFPGEVPDAEYRAEVVVPGKN